MLYEYEKINYDNMLPFRIFFVSIARRNIHRHNELELIWCIKGRVKIFINAKSNNQELQLNENDLYLFNSNEVHGFAHQEEENILVTVQIKIEYLRLYFPEIDQVYFERGNAKPDKLNIIRKNIAEMIKVIEETKMSEKKLMVFRLISQYNMLLSNIFETFPERIKADGSGICDEFTAERLNRILKYVNENYMNKLTLNEIASREHIDLSYLSRYIKNALGMNFQDYLNWIRLEKAVDFLINTNEPVMDIAMRSGFSDIKYLSKALRKEYGFTASKFRETFRKKKFETIDITKEGQEHFPVNYYHCISIMNKLAEGI